MSNSETSGSRSPIFMVALMTFLSSAMILIILSQAGVIAFTGAGWIVNKLNLISRYLGYSILFFIPVFMGYGLFFSLLRSSLIRFRSDPEQMENIRFYNAGTDIFITLSFAIGVLFTAWGLQNALVCALGGVSEEEAGRLGAWGILKQLVENGFLIAFWTTIVGGACGYFMRLLKFVCLGRELSRLSGWQRDQERTTLFQTLETIRLHLNRIEQNITGKA